VQLKGLAGNRSSCDDLQMADASFEIRPARDEDRHPLAVLFAAVAEERTGIAAEHRLVVSTHYPFMDHPNPGHP
jgi:hypothetical protein